MQFPIGLISSLRVSKKVAVLTGAGVSAESGLQTFRDASDRPSRDFPQVVSKGTSQAIWSQYRPEDLATPEAFERNPELVWEFYAMRCLKAGEVKPNPGHIALAEMGQHIPHFTLITQNVDGLHQQAGSADVVELHGNITRVKCTHGCGVVNVWEQLPDRMPICPSCGAKLRPDVVWFGEMLPRAELEVALEAARKCQVFFSIGTSSLVQPAAFLPVLAGQNGALVVEINTAKTALRPSADYRLQGRSGQILPVLVKQTWA
jgi:NAD-dependent deacetylase